MYRDKAVKKSTKSTKKHKKYQKSSKNTKKVKKCAEKYKKLQAKSLDIVKRSFPFSIIDVWNKLPPEVFADGFDEIDKKKILKFKSAISKLPLV